MEKLVVKLNGGAKDAQSKREGIYKLSLDIVNGKLYWIQEEGTSALWFDKTNENWKIGSKENIKQLLNRLLESFSEPQHVQDFQIPVSLSLGISLAPQMGTDFDKLMRFADKAMYEAKNTTGFCYKYYSE